MYGKEVLYEVVGSIIGGATGVAFRLDSGKIFHRCCRALWFRGIFGTRKVYQCISLEGGGFSNFFFLKIEVIDRDKKTPERQKESFSICLSGVFLPRRDYK